MTTIKSNALFLADCLSVMERIGSAEVTLIYLDPPFDLPLALLWKVLLQSHRVLNEHGSIFLHSHPRIAGSYRSLLDQAFGADQFVSEFIWSHHSPRGFSSNRPRLEHDTIWFYAKSDGFVYNQLSRPMTDTEKRELFAFADETGPYRLVSLIAPYIRPSMQFEWRGVLPPPNQSWRYALARLEELDNEGKLDWTHQGALPREKRYHSDQDSVPIGSVWEDIPRLHRSEIRGRKPFPSQKPRRLADRIVRLSSNPGDTVLDPFCGSGTTLLAAQTSDRRWIGCDISSDAIALTVAGLRQLETPLEEDFQEGDQDQVVAQWQTLPYYYRPLIMPGDISTCPLVLTEGKSDWKHLKAAFSRLRDQGLYREFDIEFYEYGDGIEMGSGELVNLCRQMSKISNYRTLVCIFDSDESKYVTQVTNRDGSPKDWGNRVFSFALPVPGHRIEEVSGVCIELYYTDAEIRRTDENGRRLYLNTEFSHSGKHKTKRSLTCSQTKIVRSPQLKIIDSEVYDDSDKNVALSKDRFAQYVLTNEPNFHDFEFSSFRRVFDIIVEICMK